MGRAGQGCRPPATGPGATAGHRGRRPGLAGLAGIEAGAIRGARPCDMITAPGWRADRAWLSRRGVLELFPGSRHLGHPGSPAI